MIVFLTVLQRKVIIMAVNRKAAVMAALLAVGMLASPSVYALEAEYYMNDGDVGYTDEDFLTIALNDFKVQSGSNGTKMTLKWDTVPNAEGYVVYIYKNGEYTKYKTTKSTSISIPGLKMGTTYKFMIRPVIDGQVADVSAKTDGMLTVMKPVVTAACEAKSITLDWTNISAAKKYAVYQVDGKGKLKKLKETTKHTYKVTGLKPDTRYKFCVKAYIAGSWTTVEGSDYISVRTKKR